MFKYHVIAAHEQASQFLGDSSHPEGGTINATIHAGMLEYLSWAYVTGDVYFPVHRKGAMDLYIYSLAQSHVSGDKVKEVSRVQEGDMVVIQSGAADFPVSECIGADFQAFEFWFSESGVLQGNEQPSFLKLKDTQFPIKIIGDVIVRDVFGGNAPVMHMNGMVIKDLVIPSGKEYRYDVFKNRKIGIYIVRGEGRINNHPYIKGDFIHLEQPDEKVDVLTLVSEGENVSRIFLIDLKEYKEE